MTTERTPLRGIAAILERRRIKRILIIRDGALVGIVSRANLSSRNVIVLKAKIYLWGLVGCPAERKTRIARSLRCPVSPIR